MSARTDRVPHGSVHAGPDPDAVFERERPRLIGLAYRLLGSVTDAEDVVQEAWLRWHGADVAAIERPAAWLTTVVSRIGLDRLRAARRARVDYVGPWLPEPIIEPIDADQPARTAELADSLTTAFLVVLERLAPHERLVLLLVDVFGEPFATAAAATGRTEESCRQLAVRARRKLRGASVDERPTAAREQLAIAASFVGAVMSGDLDTVVSMLSPTAVLTSDGGAHVHAARRPVLGPQRIGRLLVNIARRVDVDAMQVGVAWVNGRPGVVVSHRGEPVLASEIDVVDGLVQRYFVFVNPAKLRPSSRTPAIV